MKEDFEKELEQVTDEDEKAVQTPNVDDEDQPNNEADNSSEQNLAISLEEATVDDEEKEIIYDNQQYNVTLLFAVFAGSLGIHRFINGKFNSGLLMLFTFGGCGIWTFIDVCTIMSGSFTNADDKIICYEGKFKENFVNIIAIFIFVINIVFSLVVMGKILDVSSVNNNIISSTDFTQTDEFISDESLDSQGTDIMESLELQVIKYEEYQSKDEFFQPATDSKFMVVELLVKAKRAFELNPMSFEVGNDIAIYQPLEISSESIKDIDTAVTIDEKEEVTVKLIFEIPKSESVRELRYQDFNGNLISVSLPK